MADQGTEGLLSPYLRAKRLQAAKPLLSGSVLDIGCGSGALAGLVDSSLYTGVDIDHFSLQRARTNHPEHIFLTEIPKLKKFETIVSLAVIEHVADPVEFLRTLGEHLTDQPTARIVITTPHPTVHWVHDFGAAIGLFSRHASEEHEELLDRKKLDSSSKSAGLTMVSYSRFLFGANQLSSFSRHPS